ncbi:GGDEF domain-containing protein [Arcobacter sp. KX21116]|jgi:EAL domain-containing protein (putative c-di-GMP-specific phosphodiesterase class I)/GGDEF domain-containing protein|uniref:EAL domain-containing protein n=1 Tax=Arcobacter iocasae TaxID=2906515 RepID=UPI0035D43A17
MIKKYSDEIILILLILIISPILIELNLFEKIYNFTRDYEKYKLDEFFLIFISILIALSLYALKKVKDLKKVKKELISINGIDTLTKLENRNAFLNINESEYKYVVLLNVIDFGVFNKYLGFKKADKLLVMIANELNSIIKENLEVKLYRIYGDEFAFYSNESNIEHSIKRIKLLFEKKSFNLDKNEFTIHLNFAYSERAPKYLTALSALRYARNSIHKSIYHYNEDIDIKSDSLEMLTTLENGFKDKRVIPVYQAIHDNKNKLTYKYEALVRIKEKDILLSPYLFIDVAKKFKLYHKITRNIFEHTFNDFKDLTDEFSINLSYIDVINQHTNEFIFKMLDSHPNIANRLTIEFLETENIMDYEFLIQFTNQLRQYGTKVALDDFGSGYSNWNNILKLKPDYLKIDGSLIQNLVNNQNNINIIKLIVEFSKINGIKTVAEFVDNEKLAQLIIDLGIDYSQGYLYAQPKEKHLIWKN